MSYQTKHYNMDTLRITERYMSNMHTNKLEQPSSKHKRDNRRIQTLKYKNKYDKFEQEHLQ